VFYLCRRCDRGQQYCSQRCREKARRLQRREANRRYQQTWYGREDHRDRQRDYRVRLRARVTDQSSIRSFPCASMSVPNEVRPVPTSAAPEQFPSGDSKCPVDCVVCQICGRRGRWVIPFPGGAP